MSKLSNNQSGFGAVEITMTLAIIILLGVVGWFVYDRNHNKNTPAPVTANSSQTAISQPVDPYAGWKTATFTGDKLSLRYPSSWTASTDSTTKGLLLEKTSGEGKLIIRLEFAADGLIANAGGNYGYKPVSSFTFNTKRAYLVSDKYGGIYYMSSCVAPSLCFFSPKNNSQYKGIDEDLTFNTTGQQQESTLPSDSTSISEAIKIMATLSY